MVLRRGPGGWGGDTNINFPAIHLSGGGTDGRTGGEGVFQAVFPPPGIRFGI